LDSKGPYDRYSSFALNVHSLQHKTRLDETDDLFFKLFNELEPC